MGQLSQAHTMGAIPCWLTSFPPTKKKKQLSIIILPKFPMPSSNNFTGEDVYGIRIYLEQLDTSGKYVYSLTFPQGLIFIRIYNGSRGCANLWTESIRQT